MKIEEQVCTLEQAKQLYETGEINLSSLYRWYDGLDKDSHKPKEPYLSNALTFRDKVFLPFIYPAYTVAELGKLLPGRIYTKTGWSYLYQYKIDPDNEQKTEFALIYKNSGRSKKTVPLAPITGKTEAEARANMLLYLLEEYGICPSIINERS
ncbi:MAG: hypothetical protein LIP06_05635 [Tannerellaceae bacterium]|nr:hypothetical protein [Tannerellaceae bacterium]